MPGELVYLNIVEQVANIVAVELKELHLYAELTEVGLLPPVLNLLEDEVEHSWHDANLLIWQAHRATRPHRMRFSRASLPVGKNSRIIACETAENQVL